MKKTILTSVAIAAFAISPSFAADDVQINESRFDWTGWYWGGHVGHGSGDADWSFSAIPVGGASDRGTPGQDIDTDIDGIVGGVHVGHSWQNSQWVYGLEASISGTGVDGSTASVFGVGDDVYETEIDYIFGLSARLGITNGNQLYYVKGGYAGADIETTIVDTFPGTQSGSDSEWHNGYQVGAGVEVVSNSGIVWGLEYTYYDFREEAHSVTFAPTGGTVVDNVGVDMHTVMARISFKLN